MGSNSKSIIVSSPAIWQDVQGIVRSLDDADLLDRFVTTLAVAARASPDGNVGLPLMLDPLSRRQVPKCIWEKTDCIWGRELMRVMAARCLGRRAAHKAWKWAEESYDRTVASRYSGRAPVVYGMEHSSRITFSEQKKHGGMCALRQINSHILDFVEVLQSESEAHFALLSRYQREVAEGIDEMVAPRLGQIEDADLIIGNSRYVYESFLREGVPECKLAYVPTGCPPLSSIPARSGSGGSKLRFVYSGTLSVRKGIARLLDAWAQAGLSGHAELHVFGVNEFGPSLLRDARGVNYHGQQSASRIRQAIEETDVFVLPTLSEGRAHAVLEAVSAGLPVVTTRESGCTDVVKHLENGLLVRRADTKALENALLWCVENRGKLPEMGARSRCLAAGWPVWKARQAHLQIMMEYVEKGSLGSWRDSHLH